MSKVAQLQSDPEAPDLKDQSPLDVLLALVGEDLQAVNRTILDRMQSPVALIPQVANHLIAAGGKRLRPLLTLATAGLCGYQGDHHVKLATCVEFIHTATLLHDDVVDESELRRGRSSANTVWGNQTPVLVGDFLFSRAFELMVEPGNLAVLKTLSRASSVISEGEVLQLITSNDTATTEDAYLKVIQGKTAELFAAACQVGAEVSERPEAEIKALYEFGNYLGIAFQLVDDYLDYSADEEALGKTVGDDFREGKITLPIILAVAKAREDGLQDEQAFWERVMERLEQQDGDLAHAMDLLTRHGTLEATRDRARFYGDKAVAALAPFPDNAYKDALRGIVQFCVDRAY